jgi:HSP20 family protein
MPATKPGGLVNRLVNQLFEEPFFGSAPAWGTLPLAMRDENGSLLVDVDVPGMKPEDIDVSVIGHELVVRAERKEEKKDRLYESRSFGRFEERVALPAEVDPGKVEATLNHGVLSVKMAKIAGESPRKIVVKPVE